MVRAPTRLPSRSRRGDAVEADGDESAALVQALGLGVEDFVAAGDTDHDLGVLVEPVVGNEEGWELAEGIAARMAEEFLGAGVPIDDDAVGRVRNDGDVGDGGVIGPVRETAQARIGDIGAIALAGRRDVERYRGQGVECGSGKRLLRE